MYSVYEVTIIIVELHISNVTTNRPLLYFKARLNALSDIRTYICPFFLLKGLNYNSFSVVILRIMDDLYGFYNCCYVEIVASSLVL